MVREIVSYIQKNIANGIMARKHETLSLAGAEGHQGKQGFVGCHILPEFTFMSHRKWVAVE